MTKFPQGVEVITGLIIRNKQGQILLATGKKWQNKWIVTGGHVEPGETILECAKREGREETGLDLKPVTILQYGEMINPPHFYRPVHFIHFDCLLEAKNGEVKLQDEELSEYKWVTPEEGLKMNCNSSTRSIIKAYIEYLKNV